VSTVSVHELVPLPGPHIPVHAATQLQTVNLDSPKSQLALIHQHKDDVKDENAHTADSDSDSGPLLDPTTKIEKRAFYCYDWANSVYATVSSKVFLYDTLSSQLFTLFFALCLPLSFLVYPSFAARARRKGR